MFKDNLRLIKTLKTKYICYKYKFMNKSFNVWIIDNNMLSTIHLYFPSTVYEVVKPLRMSFRWSRLRTMPLIVFKRRELVWKDSDE